MQIMLHTACPKVRIEKFAYQDNTEYALPVLVFPSPFQDFVAAPWFLRALVLPIAVSRYPFQLQLLSP
jgi:hypothetical protein